MSDKIRAYFRFSKNWAQLKDKKADYASAKVNALGDKFDSVDISVGAAKYQRRGLVTECWSGMRKIGRCFLRLYQIAERIRGLGPDETSYEKSLQRRADRKLQREHDKLVGEFLKDYFEGLAATNGKELALINLALINKDKGLFNLRENLANIYRNDMFKTGRWLGADAPREKSQLALQTHQKTMDTFSEAWDALDEALNNAGHLVDGIRNKDEAKYKYVCELMDTTVSMAVKDAFGSAFEYDGYGDHNWGLGNNYSVDSSTSSDSEPTLSETDSARYHYHYYDSDYDSDLLPMLGDSGGYGSVTNTGSEEDDESQDK